MEHQKDTRQNNQTSYGHTSAASTKSLENKTVFAFVSKKTEKLVTALYMVTDCMEEGDALKAKIRVLGVELISVMYRLETLSPTDKKSHINLSFAHIEELISFVDIACTIGFISSMNGTILKRELLLLRGELKATESEAARFSFSLNDQMFDVPRPSPQVFNSPEQRSSHILKDIKDTSRNNKKTFNMSFRSINPSLSLTKPSPRVLNNPTSKLERTNKILKIIKDTSANQKDTNGGVSIKDISIAFTDCSEKTIQRELNTLVAEGKLKKTGAKRWSRYALKLPN